MKSSFKSITLLFLCFLMFFVSIPGFSQDKTDVVVMINGEERTGKVVAINDQDIIFIYVNETLEYQIKKTEINKIVFASGRTQIFTENSEESSKEQKIAAKDRKGKMAVLPFKIITNMPTIDTDAMGKQIQHDCAHTIKEEAPAIEVIDSRVVNATLAKNSISGNQLHDMLPNELAELLGVEHVVFGSYDIKITGTRSSGSTVTTYKSKKDDDKRKGTEISSGSSSTSDTFDSEITLDIYDDQGASIYSASRKPFSAGLDNYHGTISYLIKRAPFANR